MLLALTEAGVPREEAYRIVQRNAMSACGRMAPISSRRCSPTKDVTKALSTEQIRAQFDLGYHLKHVDTIFARVFGTK